MKYIIAVLLATIVISIHSCKTKENNKLIIEQAFIDTLLQDNFVLPIYKGVKKSLRSLNINQNTQTDSILSIINKDKNNSKIIKKYISFLIKKIIINDKKAKFSIMNYYSLVNELKKLSKKKEFKDEDFYPTLLEILSYISPIDEFEILNNIKWTNSKEHFFMGFTLYSNKNLPSSLLFYELSKLNNKKLKNTEIKPLSTILKTISYLDMNLNYLAINTLNQSIKELNSNQIKYSKKIPPLIYSDTKIKNTINSQFISILNLLKAFVRYKTNDIELQKLAINDFNTFIKNATKFGYNNELVWLTSTFLNLENKEYKLAKENLNKLKASNIFGKFEIETINKLDKLFENKQTTKASEIIFDKIILTKVLYEYLNNYLNKIEDYKSVTSSKTGQLLLFIPKLIDIELEKTGIDFTKK